MERLMRRGQWKVLATLKHHVQKSAAMLVVARRPIDVMARLAALRGVGRLL